MPSTSPDDQRSQQGSDAPGIQPQDHEPTAITNTEAIHQEGAIGGPEETPNAATALLERYNRDSEQTARPRRARGYGSFASTYAETLNSFEQSRPGLGARYETSDDFNTQSRGGIVEHLPDAVTEGLLGKPKAHGVTSWLRERAGIKEKRMMSVLLTPLQFLTLEIELTALGTQYTDNLVGMSITTFHLQTGFSNTGGSSYVGT